ncbi:MAG TPA: hypothetical protein VLA21_00320 [Candidatus Limnocylindria bacterium]|nr:hypothetical protein [Candidatus Limnocylindria bacterium]
MIDAHVHLQPGDPGPLLERLAAFGADRFCALGVPVVFGADNNLRCLRLKRLYPGRAWAYGGLIWNRYGCPMPETQLGLLLDAGFDGLKLIETKPNYQKELGFLPDAPEFAPMFALAQERGAPVTWHVGDPATFWDNARAPGFAAENGWTYDGPGFMSLEELYRRTENVLRAHPRLKATLAHLYFCSDDRAHLERVLAEFPEVSVDLTPGSEMYRDFAHDVAGWGAFFREHSLRIVLGTDMTNEPDDPHWRELSLLTRAVLRHEPFEVWDLASEGFDLGGERVRAITGGNFTRLAGDSPKPINARGLATLMAFYHDHLDPADYAACREVYEESYA